MPATHSPSYDELVSGLRDMTRLVQNEGRLVRAGLKSGQDTAAIMSRYSWLASPGALEVSGRRTDEAGRRVRAALMQATIDRAVAAHRDGLATHYSAARVSVGGASLPFHSAVAELAREPDPGRREALGDATGAVMAEADELAVALSAGRLRAMRELGYEGATAFWSDVKQVDYGPLRAESLRLAAAAGPMYRAWVEPRMRAAAGAFGDCPQAHMPFFRALREHDPVFTADRFEPAMRRTFAALGLDVFGTPAIHLDLVDRPGKSPRASVWVPEAGCEVHLLVRPAGGSLDYAAFLHESGHALHHALTDTTIGWPLANLGRSAAYDEVWSFLIEHVMCDPAWIADAVGASAAAAERIAGDLAGVDLMLFVRHAGKLDVELELYAGDPLDAGWGRRVFAGGLGRVTGFRYDPRAWQFDRDDGFYSADYLRAWQVEAALDRWLRESFGERWWASRDAGAWLREQWRRGSEPEAEEVLAETGARARPGDALLARFQRGLRR